MSPPSWRPRGHPGFDQVLDGRDRLGVGLVEEFVFLVGSFVAGGDALGQQRRAGHIVFHDGAEDRRLEMLPVAVVLGHGDEIGAVEHAGDAGHVEQPAASGERAAASRLANSRVPPSAGAAGNQFQGGGIGRGFGLDEHRFLLRRRFKAGAWLTSADGDGGCTIKADLMQHPEPSAISSVRFPRPVRARECQLRLSDRRYPRRSGRQARW